MFLFSHDSVDPHYRLDGIMDQNQYKDIMTSTILSHARSVMSWGWISQQDKDPKHSAISKKQLLASKKVRVFEWPSQNLDLNLFEYLQEHLHKQIRDFKPSDKDQFFNYFSRVQSDILIKLVYSMPCRCQAVIDSRGYTTK